MLSTGLLPSTLLGQPSPPGRRRPLQASVRKPVTGLPRWWDLGPVGVCSGSPTLLIVAIDNSGSVTAAGGADPVSNRFNEAALGFEALARSCRCGMEQAAVITFDTPTGDIPPTILSKQNLASLRTGLTVPAGAYGSSDLGPALDAATRYAMAAPQAETVLAVLSDFEITDTDPDHVLTRLGEFPGTVIGCLLGAEQSRDIPGCDTVVAIGHHHRPGSLAAQILAAGITHRT